MPDRPLANLDGRTPLEASETPFMDDLVKSSELGTVNHIPKGMKSGSDVPRVAENIKLAENNSILCRQHHQKA